MDIRTTRYGDMGLVDPVAIIGFPGAGLVSSIMPNYYVSQLRMKPIAGMSSPDMPPYCLISHGMAMPPVRFYGYKGKGKTGRDAIVCMSEYSPKPEHCYDLCHAIMEYLRKKDCKTIICLEGTPRFTPEDKMSVCGSGPEAAKLMKKTKLNVMEGGMVRGTTGVMLYDGPLAGFTVVAMLCPAIQNVPDPGSAAKFVVPISKLVTGFKVNTEELLTEAEEIQKKIEAEAEAENKETTAPYFG